MDSQDLSCATTYKVKYMSVQLTAQSNNLFTWQLQSKLFLGGRIAAVCEDRVVQVCGVWYHVAGAVAR